jgi:hypothetical protein
VRAAGGCSTKRRPHFDVFSEQGWAMATLTLSKSDEQEIEALAKSWVELLELPCPNDSWLQLLLRRGGAEVAMAAIEQTRKKARWERRNGTPMTGDGVRIYCLVTADKMAFPGRQSPARQMGDDTKWHQMTRFRGP